MTLASRRCHWCGDSLTRRDKESPSAFGRRKHCSRSCQVSTQNSDRARRNRIARDRMERREKP